MPLRDRCCDARLPCSLRRAQCRGTAVVTERALRARGGLRKTKLRGTLFNTGDEPQRVSEYRKVRKNDLRSQNISN
jgi:hypothetical protein